MPKMPYEVNSGTIKRIRDKHLLTQREFAHLCGVTEETVKNWENGRATPLQRPMRELIKLGKDAGIEAELFIIRAREVARQSVH